ncbi:alpha/beta hydrolase, partial [Streptomyces nigra]
MRRSAAVLCGATVVLAGTLTAVPANASSPHSASTALSTAVAKVSWKKCGTDDTPTLQCGTVKVPLDYAKPRGRQ